MFTSRDNAQFHCIKTAVTKQLCGHLSDIPYDHYTNRVKSATSIQQKLIRKGLDTTPQQALLHLTDIIGVRFITRYITEIYQIVDRIRIHFHVIDEHDYINTPKPSGYRSYHVIIAVPITCDTPYLHTGETIPVEIQIRTMGMDFWASLEHSLVYKQGSHSNNKNRNTTLIQKELQHYAEDIFSIDMRLQALAKLTEESL